MRPLQGLLVGLGLLLSVASAAPAAAENVLRWASAGGVLTWDPHATTETPSLVGFRQVYETLVTIDTDLTLQPGLADAEHRLEALLRGDIDFLQDPPLEALDRIRQRPGLRLAQTGELRVLLLGLNQGTAELHSSDVEGANPLKDRRVRQATYQAIDIAAIRDEVMQGLAIPAGMTITPGVNGYAPELDQRLAFDPRAAKSLLDQAGYGDGFALRLDCPSNRYLNDAAICDALGAQLRTIGIRVTVDNQPKDIHFAKIFQRETDFYLLGFLTPSFDSALHFHELFHSRPGPWGATGYTNPVLDALIERIDGELGTYHRDAMIEQAWKIILDDIVVVPLHRQVVVWALRETLDLPISPLNSPAFREARLN